MSIDKKKPVSPFGVRMSDEMRKQVGERAQQNGRSMNSEIVQILKEALAGTAEKTAYERGKRDGYELGSNP
jgi:plasmid stability protein